MSKPFKSKVIQTKYVMSEILDYTDARVRTQKGDIWVRLGGKKTEEEHEALIIEEAEKQMAAQNLNGAAVI